LTQALLTESKFRLLLVCVSVVIALAVHNAAVQATNLAVNSLGDEPDVTINGNCLTAVGTCTLRAAIQEANAIGGPDTITFGMTGTILLTSSLPPINEALTITGPGPAQLTIDSNSTGTIFTTNANAVITGMTMTRASTIAAVVSNSGWASLTNVTITNNTAGVQINVAAILTIINSTVSTNQNGGIAIAMNGSSPAQGSLIQNTTVEGNTGTGVVFSSFIEGSLLKIDSSTIRNNTGDGVSAGTNELGDRAGSQFEMVNSTVSNNGGRGVASMGRNKITGSVISGNTGGGILNYAGLTITNSTISGNSADSGAGISVSGLPMLASSTSVINTTISGNTATTRGGGLFNSGGSSQFRPATVEMLNSTISGNQAPSGGGISGNAAYGSTNLVHVTVANNTAAAGSGCTTLA